MQAAISFQVIDARHSYGRYTLGETSFTVVIRQPDDFINASHLVKNGRTKGGKEKQLKTWSASAGAQELLKEAQATLGVPLDSIWQPLLGNFTNNDLRGTYVHPLLVPHLCCWLSPAFAIGVSLVINARVAASAAEDNARKANQLAICVEARQVAEAALQGAEARAQRTTAALTELLEFAANADRHATDMNIKLDEVLERNEELRQLAKDTNLAVQQLKTRAVPVGVAIQTEVVMVVSRVLQEPPLFRGATKYKFIGCQARSEQAALDRAAASGYDVTTPLRVQNVPSATKLIAAIFERFQGLRGVGSTVPSRRDTVLNIKGRVVCCLLSRAEVCSIIREAKAAATSV